MLEYPVFLPAVPAADRDWRGFYLEFAVTELALLCLAGLAAVAACFPVPARSLLLALSVICLVLMHFIEGY